MKKGTKEIKLRINTNETRVFSFVWINGREKIVNLYAELIGENASLTIVGIFLGNTNHSVVFNTNVIHKSPHTKSLTHIRGVFKDKSSFNNDGMVHIAKGARGADGYFASKILLLNDAKGRSVPSLEIDENDLKAGHASTIGRPDEQQVFYLRSRGLSEKEAETIIVSGFFEPTLQMLDTKDQKETREKLQASLK